MSFEVVSNVISSAIEISSLSIWILFDSFKISTLVVLKSNEHNSLLVVGDAPIYIALSSQKLKSLIEVWFTSISSIISPDKLILRINPLFLSFEEPFRKI